MQLCIVLVRLYYLFFKIFFFQHFYFFILLLVLAEQPESTLLNGPPHLQITPNPSASIGYNYDKARILTRFRAVLWKP
jgi:hypothetical protein